MADWKIEDIEDEDAAGYSFSDFQQCFFWRHFLDVVQASMLVSRGVSDEQLLETRHDSEHGVACAVAVAQTVDPLIIFVTKAFESLTGYTADEAVGASWRSVLLPGDPNIHERINMEGVRELEDFCEAALEKDTTEFPKEFTQVRVLFLGLHKKGDLRWLLLEVAAVPFNSSLHLLFIARQLRMPSLQILDGGTSPSPAREAGVSNLLWGLRAKLQTTATIQTSSVVAHILEEETCAWLRSGRGEEYVSLRRVSAVMTKQGTLSIKHGFNVLEFLSKCEESFQLAHSGFWNAVNSKDASYLVGFSATSPDKHVKDTDYSDVAWVIADSEAADIPLVYVSKGFQQLTGYPAKQVLGRNCRFLQLLDRDKNQVVNGNECKRLKEFCAEKVVYKKISTLLLNQDSRGRYFLNLLAIFHISFESKTYTMGTLTKLSSLNHQVMSIFTQMDSRSVTMIEKIRAAVMTREARFSPLPWHASSNETVLEECVIGWMQDCGQEVPEFWKGDHFVPPLGVLSAKKFEDRWPSVLETVQESVASMCSIQQEEILANTTRNRSGGVAFGVVDPSGADSTLVFVSREFEVITGYDSDFALGRNSDFLLPHDKTFNQVINGAALRNVRAFYEALKRNEAMKRLTTETCVSTIIYETRGGARFWCLSRMAAVEVSGFRYALIVLVPIPSIMPTLLASRLDILLDEDFISLSVHDLTPSLARLLSQLNASEAKQAGQDLRTYVQQSIHAWIRHATDSIEGDHQVAKIGRAAAHSFEYDRKSNRLLCALASNEGSEGICSEIRDSEGKPNNLSTFWSVADCTLRDCPIVHVSKNFEDITGYSRDWALGRNCRFLQPKTACWNDAINKKERRIMRAFTRLPPKRRHMAMQLLNETKDGRIFWNLLVMTHICLDGHPYIVALQRLIPQHLDVISELLLGGARGIELLDKFRALVHRQLTAFDEDSWAHLLSQCMMQWLQDVPVSKIMRLSAPHDTRKSKTPPVGVELTRFTDLQSVLPAVIEEGVRHLVLNFANCSGDTKEHEFQAQLFQLKVVNVFGLIRQRCFHYLVNLTFTIRAKPGQESVCMEILRCARQAGIRIDLWLLDTSSASIADCQQSWQQLSQAQQNDELTALGLYGNTSQLAKMQKAVSSKSDVKVAALAFDWSPDTKTSLDSVANSISGEVSVILFGIYGNKNYLLHDKGIHAIAAKFDMDPCMVLVKWAQGLGFLCVVPCLRTSKDAPDGFLPASSKIDPYVGAHSTFLADYCGGPNPKEIVDQIARLSFADKIGAISGYAPSPTSAQAPASSITHTPFRRRSTGTMSSRRASAEVFWAAEKDPAIAVAPLQIQREAAVSTQHSLGPAKRLVRRNSTGHSKTPSIEAHLSPKRRGSKSRMTEASSSANEMLQVSTEQVESTKSATGRSFLMSSTEPVNPESLENHAASHAHSSKELSEQVDKSADITSQLSATSSVVRRRSTGSVETRETQEVLHPATDEVPQPSSLFVRRRTLDGFSGETHTSQAVSPPQRSPSHKNGTSSVVRRRSTGSVETRETQEVLHPATDEVPHPSSLFVRRRTLDGFSGESHTSQAVLPPQRVSPQQFEAAPKISRLPEIEVFNTLVDPGPLQQACQAAAQTNAQVSPCLTDRVDDSASAAAALEQTFTASSNVQAPTRTSRRSSTKEKLLGGMFGRPQRAGSEADPLSNASTRMQTLEMCSGSDRSTSEAAEQKDAEQKDAVILPSLPAGTQGVQSHPETVLPIHPVLDASSISGFGVLSSSSANADCEEKTDEPQQQQQRRRSRFGLPFGPQAPVEPPLHAGHRPVRASGKS